MEISWISIVPVVITIILAFATKNVFVSLLVGIITAGTILDIKTETLFIGLDSIVNVFKDDWAAKSIFFCLMIGAFVYLIEVSGGVQGTIEYLTKKRNIVKSKKGAQLLAYLLGIIISIDGISSIVISGVAARPLFDHFKVPRERLAYISDSTSSPVAWLMPFNAAGAFLLAMIGGQVSLGVIDVDPMKTIISTIPFQLYGIISIVLVGVVIMRGSGKENIEELLEKEEMYSAELKIDEHIIPSIKNMIVPIIILVTSIFSIMILTKDGSTGVYIGAIITLLATGLFYIIQGITTVEKYFDWIVKGMSGYLGITMILTLAFAFSSLIGQLGTGVFIASISNNINPVFIPVMVFFIGAIMSFATGTSAGTVAILIPIVFPMAVAMEIELPIIMGAIISGGVFGDHCSPISDSTILASMIAEVNVMDHVKTQIPFALTSGILAGIGFLILGVI